MSSAVAAPELVEPAFAWVPPHDSTSGPDAVDLAASAGLFLDPWQAWALDGVLAERDDGALASFESGIIVSRQNGKGSILEALVLHWLFLEDVELVLWSAHEFKTAAEGFRRMRVLLQGAPDLWPLVARITTANGDESIELTTGQRLKFVARSKASGKGFTGDKIILDEAYDLDGDEIAALIPTLATRPDPQIVYTSSAGMADSHVLRAVRDRGRAGGDPSLCWLEWCATPAGEDEHGKPVYDLDDREQWRRANPGVAAGRITEEFIAKERRAMLSVPERFGRERLGVWDEPEELAQPITSGAWADCLDVGSTRDGLPALAIDVSPDRAHSAVSYAANRPDGLPMVQVVRHGEGVDWLVAHVAALVRDKGAKCVVIDGVGPVSNLARELTEALADAAPLVVMSTSDVCDAWGSLYDAVATKQMRHLGQPELDAALHGATVRMVGARKAWDRKTSADDITPLVSATHAMWGLATQTGPAFFASSR